VVLLVFAVRGYFGAAGGKHSSQQFPPGWVGALIVGGIALAVILGTESRWPPPAATRAKLGLSSDSRESEEPAARPSEELD
jgi:hypothetical protein